MQFHQNNFKLANIPQLSCKHWCILNANNGQFLKGSRDKEQREMASLTKIMTCITAFKLIQRFQLDPTKIYFSVSLNAASVGGTSAKLDYEDWVLINDLFYALMLPSGNDAAITLSENFGCMLYFHSIGKSDVFKTVSSVDVLDDVYLDQYQQMFINEMNKIARELNFTNTNFANPHGLSDIHNISTCYDIASLSFHALKHDLFRQIINSKIYQCEIMIYDNDKQPQYIDVYWENTNKLLSQPGFQGVKTGVTKNAGNCLSSLYYDYNKELKQFINIIVVVLGCKDNKSRFKDTIKLVKWWQDVLQEQELNLL